MINREGQKCCMFYPENSFKSFWDLFITIILLVSCITTPYFIAFENSSSWYEYIIDVLFLMDMIIVFNTAYYDENYEIVDSRKNIA